MSVQNQTTQLEIIYLNYQENKRRLKTWLFIMVEKLELLERH